jgi:hypothetical protein
MHQPTSICRPVQWTRARRAKPLLWLVLFGVSAWAPSSPAWGQAQKKAAPTQVQAPQITSVFPPGIQRGTEQVIELRGRNLIGLNQLRFSTPDLHVRKIDVKSPERAEVTLAATKSAALAVVELRAASANGMSNLRLFRIDDLPQVNETSADNAMPAAAQAIEFPVAVNGQLAAADVDWYRVHVPGKQRVVFELEARQLGSASDPRLQLSDRSGRVLADVSATRALRPDERLDFQFTEPGDYFLMVHDAEYQGGEGNAYRLRVGQWEYASAMFPLGARRGESVEITLEGGNLVRPLVQALSANDVAQTRQRLEFTTARGTLVGPMWFVRGDEPEATEHEPNDEIKEAETLSAPVVVNGRIGAAGDRDCFRFSAKRDQEFVIEVHADRLGSWLDSVFTITDPTGRDSAGRTPVTEYDDLGTAPNQRQAVVRTSRATTDSRTVFRAPRDGEWIVSLDDRFHEGGPEFAYRLSITPNRPDFALAYGTAQNQQQQQRQTPPSTSPDVLNIEPGKSAIIPVTVERRGYDGKIELSVRGLPDGVSATPVTIADRQPGGQITIVATAAAAANQRDVQVIGTATINGQKIERPLRVDLVLASFSPVQVARRELDTLALTVVRRETPLAMIVPGQLKVLRGLGGDLKVQIDRKGTVTGPVEVLVERLPTGVTASKATIAPPASDAIVKFTATNRAAVATQPIRVLTRGKVGNETVESTSDVSLVVALPFELALSDKAKEIVLLVGESRTVKFTVTRQPGFEGAIDLSARGLPAGVTVAPAKLDPDDAEAELHFDVAENAKPLRNRKTVTIQASGLVGKDRLQVEATEIPIRIESGENQ